jgi:hypothetical protein
MDILVSVKPSTIWDAQVLNVRGAHIAQVHHTSSGGVTLLIRVDSTGTNVTNFEVAEKVKETIKNWK